MLLNQDLATRIGKEASTNCPAATRKDVIDSMCQEQQDDSITCDTKSQLVLIAVRA